MGLGTQSRGDAWSRSRGHAWNPMAGNPLRTRADALRAAQALLAPLEPYRSPGGARVRLGTSGVAFGDEAEEFEGFARPLWAAVPLALGGGDFAGFDWARVREGLASGSDPAHPEFWGEVRGTDQRMVEMAALGFALAFVPERVWDPLAEDVRQRLVAWLEAIDRHPPVRNNWQFFRVLVNLGLARVGCFSHAEAERESLGLLDGWYRGDGFYVDGDPATVDWYVPWALHAYGLLYAASPHADPERARRFRERARLFAEHHQHWFDEGGAGVPFGRSLPYRFAQGAFWGALVWADEEALPWGRVKGLLLRHLRHWAGLPIARRDGTLSVGYGYENLVVAEPYTSSGSPYWALKAFLALAQPETHPFWRAEEEPLPPQEAPSTQPHARMVFARDATHAVALSGGQSSIFFPNGGAKYGKLAYSSRFAFSVAPNEQRPHHGWHDSALSLREADGPWRVRDQVEEARADGGLVYSRWRPWPDVVVETVLAGGTPWHLRLHRIRTGRALRACDAAFSLPFAGLEAGQRSVEALGDPAAPLFRTAFGVSGIRCLGGVRRGELRFPQPNTNLLWPRTALPVLECDLAPGEHVLRSAVLAGDAALEGAWDEPPGLPAAAEALLG